MGKKIVDQQKRSFLILPMFLVILGIILGQLVVQGMKKWFPETLIRFYTGYKREAAADIMNVFEFFGYIFLEKAKKVLIFWLLDFTIFGLPYYLFCIVKKSFQISFLFGAFIIQYKIKGIFLGICNYFPELIALIPLYYLCLKFGFRFLTETQNGQSFHGNGGILLKKYIPWILLTLLLCAFDAALATWFGQPVLNWALQWIEKGNT